MDPRLQLRVQRYGWDAAAPYYQESWAAQLKPAAKLLPRFGGNDAIAAGLISFRLWMRRLHPKYVQCFSLPARPD